VIPEKSQSLLEAYDRWRGWADDKVCCDYSLRVFIPSWNDQTAQEMEILTKEKGQVFSWILDFLLSVVRGRFDMQ